MDDFNDVSPAGVGQVISGWDVGVNGRYYICLHLVLNTQLLISANFMLCAC